MHEVYILATIIATCVAIFAAVPGLLSTAGGIKLQSRAIGLSVMVLAYMAISVIVAIVDYNSHPIKYLDVEDVLTAGYFVFGPIWYVVLLHGYPLLGSLYAFPPGVSAWASQHVLQSIKPEKAKLVCVGAFLAAVVTLYYPFITQWQSGEWNGMIAAIAMLCLLSFYADILHSSLGIIRQRAREMEFGNEIPGLLKPVFMMIKLSVLKTLVIVTYLLYILRIVSQDVQMKNTPGHNELMYGLYHDNPSFIYSIGIVLFGLVPASSNFSVHAMTKRPSVLRQLVWNYGDTMNLTARYMAISAYLICLLVCSLAFHLTSIGTGVLLYALVVSLWTCSLLVSECRYSLGIATVLHRDYGYNPSSHLTTYFDLLEDDEYVVSKTPHRVEHGPNRI